MISQLWWPSILLQAILTTSTFVKSSNAAAPDDYASNAKVAIEKLNADWYSTQTGIWDSAWWNSANALTTLADFALLRIDDANELNLGGYMRHTFVQAQKATIMTVKTMDAQGMTASTYCIDWNEGCMVKRDFLEKRGFDDFLNEFYDDQGWWALAMVRSYDASGDKDYLDAAVKITQDMATGLGGPCNGGVYWNRDRQYVNAITNELYLTMLASLANRIPQDPSYLDLAKAQWQWFENSGMINKDNLVNDGLTSTCENNGLQTWSYNQGVILGGLAELYRATGDKKLLDRGTAIAKAAIEHLSNEDGVLVETDKCELSSGHCGVDGPQFKGIFIRNLRYFDEVAPDPQFKSFITKNADVIWANNRGANAEMGVAWNGPVVAYNGKSHSSALDALVAAIAVA
ncbi:putative mannan endo-1,6-alpha-mannosidase [Paramyrothecium foliicola]|nr:putative mannan endo-1,6-alpha-mannosidase [Paramyrothecium foliicola]